MLRVSRLVSFALLAVTAAACNGSDAPAIKGLAFRAQCAPEDRGAVQVKVQGQKAWFGPVRRFGLDQAMAATDAQGHPAITLLLDPGEHQRFEAFVGASVDGPLAIFFDGELVAAPAAQPITGGRFTFCNEAGGWTAADRDRWLGRIQESAGK